MYDEKRRNGELAAAKEEGVTLGVAQGVAQVAKNMLEAGLPYDQISQLTGLDIETIQHLASTMTDAE